MRALRHALTAGLIAWAAGEGMAEGLRLELKLENNSVLQYEPVIAFLTLHNDTPTPLVIEEGSDRNQAHVDFVVRKTPGDSVPRLKKDPVLARLNIEADAKEETMIEISDFLDMKGKGRYLVHAVAEWNGRTYASEIAMIDVVDGFELASVTRSVPGYPNMVRRYTLRYWSRNRQEYLFLVVDDENAKLNYGVFSLGPLVRVHDPRIEAGRSGYITVVHQLGPDSYVHSFFESTRDGVHFLDHEYRREDGEVINREPPAVKPGTTKSR